MIPIFLLIETLQFGIEGQILHINFLAFLMINFQSQLQWIFVDFVPNYELRVFKE